MGAFKYIQSGGKFYVSFVNGRMIIPWKKRWIPTSATIDITKWSVSFDSNGGSGEMEDVSVNDNTSYTIPNCTFTAPEGQQFKNWSIGETEYNPDDEIVVLNNITLVANWEATSD